MTIRVYDTHHNSARIGLVEAAEQVRVFHQKHGFDCEVGFSSRVLSRDPQLEVAGQALVAISRELETAYMQTRDTRLLRAHLMLEELGETLAAMAFADLDGFYDGLADLAYVTLGSAVAIGPRHALAFVFDEVHRSNMTKEVRPTSAEDDPRLRNKGKNYMPPDIHKAVQLARLGVQLQTRRYRVLDVGAVSTIVVVESIRLDGTAPTCSKLIIPTAEMMAFHRAMGILGVEEVPGIEGDGS